MNRQPLVPDTRPMTDAARLDEIEARARASVCVTPGPGVPRLLMQTWKTTEVPEIWKSSVESIQRVLPAWTHVLMTDADNRLLVQRHFPDLLPYYDAFPYNIQRADAVRYCWLYMFGGVYMDLDFVVHEPLDQLFGPDVPDAETGLFLVRSGNLATYMTNSFMASTPGHPFWLEMIEHMKQCVVWWARVCKHSVVMTTTGPIAVTWVVASGERTPFSDLPRKRLMPFSEDQVEGCVHEPGMILTPLPGKSWNGPDSHVINQIGRLWKWMNKDGVASVEASAMQGSNGSQSGGDKGEVVEGLLQRDRSLPVYATTPGCMSRFSRMTGTVRAWVSSA